MIQKMCKSPRTKPCFFFLGGKNTLPSCQNMANVGYSPF